MVMVDQAGEVFINFIGEELYFVWATICVLHVLNCLLTQFFGMKKLDMLFDGKVYNDTFSRELHFRYFCHCVRYMCGDVSVEGKWMKLWLRISVLGEMTLILSVLIIACIWGYLAIVT